MTHGSTSPLNHYASPSSTFTCISLRPSRHSIQKTTSGYSRYLRVSDTCQKVLRESFLTIPVPRVCTCLSCHIILSENTDMKKHLMMQPCTPHSQKLAALTHSHILQLILANRLKLNYIQNITFSSQQRLFQISLLLH
jgi:hypothetical protein